MRKFYNENPAAPDDVPANGSRLASGGRDDGRDAARLDRDVATEGAFAFNPAMPGHVYILASRMNGTLYTGVTADLPRRVREHKEGDIPGFTEKYGVKRLVWHCFYHDIEDAIADEKRIKRWRRKWKLELIEGMNPRWRDLFDEIAN